MSRRRPVSLWLSEAAEQYFRGAFFSTEKVFVPAAKRNPSVGVADSPPIKGGKSRPRPEPSVPE